MKNVLLVAQHEGKKRDTKDVDRRHRMKVVPKVQVRDQGSPKTECGDYTIRIV